MLYSPANHPEAVVRIGKRCNLTIRQLRRDKNHTIHRTGLQQSEIFKLLVLLILRIADQNFVPEPVGGMLDPLNNLRIIGHADIRYNNSQRHRLA
ncbi:hypothetical protein D3C81_2091230 [compost metagenome]